MTNLDKFELSEAVRTYKGAEPDGAVFNLFEVWSWVKEDTGVSFKISTVRNYLKAFGGKCLSKGRSAQWTFPKGGRPK